MSRLIPKLPLNESALLNAAKSGDLLAVKSLIAKGVAVNAGSAEGMPWDQTALMYAAENGSFEIVQCLLDSGANVSSRDKAAPGEGGGQQPLHYAARSKNPRIAELLLSAGANPNALDKSGCTPLVIAIGEQNVPVVRLLVERGADVLLKPGAKSSFPPLCQASRSKNLEIIEILIARGADINASDDLGNTPIIHAAQTGSDSECACVISVLLRSGAQVDHLNERGESALSRAVYSNRKQTVKVLITGGANVNRFYKSQEGTLLDAVNKRIATNQEDAETSPEARKAAEEWEELFDLLRSLGARRQSEL